MAKTAKPCAQLNYSVAIPVKHYSDDMGSLSSYTTAIDHGMKKPPHKTIYSELRKEELGSSVGHKTIMGSTDSPLGKIEKPVIKPDSKTPVSSLVRNDLSPQIKHPIDESGPCFDFTLGTCKDFYEQHHDHLTFNKSPEESLCNATVYTEAKDSFGTTKVGDSSGSVNKSGESDKVSDSCDFVESRKTSTCRASTGTDVSDDSNLSSFSSSFNKPHQANDTRWEAIQAVRSRDGMLGINHFKLLRRLGCGDIGSVYLSELSGTKAYFAMKVMDKATLASRKKLPRAQTEREILQSLDHPFLPTLYTHFETEKFSCLVMEFCPGGDLHALRQRQPHKHFPEHAARFYVAEILLALEYLHMLGIIYRDLKPENVLVRDDGHIMLSDFDLSLRCAVSPTLVKSSNTETDLSNKNSSYCVQPACIEPSCVIQSSCIRPSCFGPFGSSKSKKEKKSKSKNGITSNARSLPELIAEPTSARSMSFVGTHEYLAPEIIKGEGHGSAVDWWTFGIFLYELLFGKTPFKGSANRATLFNVVGQPLKFPESPNVSFAARDLIRGLLVKEPKHRLAYRRGATEIKQHPFFQSINWALIRCTNPPDVPKPFTMKPSAATEMPTAPKPENGPGVDVKPSGNYLEIDFF